MPSSQGSLLQEWATGNNIALPHREARPNAAQVFKWEEETPNNILQVCQTSKESLHQLHSSSCQSIFKAEKADICAAFDEGSTDLPSGLCSSFMALKRFGQQQKLNRLPTCIQTSSTFHSSQFMTFSTLTGPRRNCMGSGSCRQSVAQCVSRQDHSHVGYRNKTL